MTADTMARPASEAPASDSPATGDPRRPGRVTRRAVSAWAALLVVAGLSVAGLLRLEVDTSMESFLPSDDPVATGLSTKADAFGGDPVVVVLQTAGDRTLVTDQDALLALVRLEGMLAQLSDVAAVYGPGTVLNQTAGAAQDMLAQISGRRDGYRQQVEAAARDQGLSPAQVKAAGDAAVAQFDERYGALLVQGLPAGLPTLKNPKFVETVLFDDEGLPRPQWRFIVPATDTVTLLVRPRADLDQAAASRLTDAVRAAVSGAGLSLERTTVTGAPVLTSALADKARAELPVLGIVSLVAVGLVFLLAPWTPRRRARFRPTVAAVAGTAITLSLFGWTGSTVSLGVVAFLPILLGIGSDFPLYLSRGGRDRQVLVAVLAAAVGFGSLLLSPLPFVQELGLALAFGLVITAGVAWAMRSAWGPVDPDAGRGARSEERATSLETPATGAPTRSARAAVALVAITTAVVGWLLLPGLQVEAQPEQLAAGLAELDDAEHAADVLGSDGEVAVVISGDEVDRPEVLDWSREVQTEVVRTLGDRVHPVLSLADLFRFLGDEPTQSQVDAARSVVPRYLTSAVLSSDDSQALMLYGVEFDDVGELSSLLSKLEGTLGSPPDGVSVDVVGLPVAAARGLELVEDGRVSMNLIGVAAAFLVLLVGLRRRADAVRGLLTVLLATGWVAAVAAFTTGSLNPLTVAIASLTTATAVEFAVVLPASGRSLRPVTTAAVAGTVGYLVLALSDLAVLRDFGLLLAAGVVCSFVAALVVCRVLLPTGLPATPATSHEEVPT